jgi:hypothetical protein
MRRYPESAMTPWFHAATQPPARQGKYRARLADGWRVVELDYWRGRWYVNSDPWQKPVPLLTSHWPGMVWRGLRKNAGVDR